MTATPDDLASYAGRAAHDLDDLPCHTDPVAAALRVEVGRLRGLLHEVLNGCGSWGEHEHLEQRIRAALGQPTTDGDTHR